MMTIEGKATMNDHNFTQYRSFKRLGFYAGSLHWQYGDLHPGSHVLYAETHADGSESQRMGRILGIVTRLPDGKTVKPSRKDPLLAILVPSADMRYGYMRFVQKSAIRSHFTPGAFARWFLYGETPPAQLAHDVQTYGAMSNDYLGKYLTAPEGALRTDWHEVAMGRKA